MALSPLRAGDLRIPTLDLNARPTGPAGMPIPEAQTKGASLILGLSDRIDQIAQRQANAADAATQEEARLAGIIAADAQPGVEMTGGGSIYRDAFNRAAVETGARRLEISARSTLTELARTHATDPVAFNDAATQYRDGLLAGLPPRLRVPAAQSFDTLALPFSNQVTENHQKFVGQQALASFEEAMPGRQTSIEQLALRAATDPAAARALAQEQAGVLADLVSMGPREGFTFAGRQYPPDPTRTAALTLQQMVARWTSLEQQGQQAGVVGQWRAAGGGQAWIDQWERDNTGATAPRGIRNNNPLNIQDGSFAKEQPGHAGSDGRFARFATMQDGLAAADRLLLSYAQRGLTTPIAIVSRWAPAAEAGNDPAAYAATVARKLGVAPNATLDMQDPATRQRLALAMAEVENGRPVPVGATAGLPIAQVLATARTLRALQAADDQAAKEAQARANTTLQPILLANQAAVQLTGQERSPVTDDQFRAAGKTDAEITAYRNGIAFGQQLFTATQQTATASPEDLTALRQRAMPGGDLFALDPRQAVTLAGRIDEQLRGRAATVLEAKLQDLRAQAAAIPDGAAPPRITREEAAAAGLTPERRDQVNGELASIARTARLVRGAATASPAEIEQAATTLPIAGDQAAENARALQAFGQALQQRAEGVQKSPGDWVLANSPVIRTAWQAAQQDPQQIGAAITATLEAQQRMGIPPAQQQPVPPSMAKAMVADLAALPTQGERLGRLAGVLTAMPSDAARQQTLAALREAGLPDATRIGAAVLPRLGPYQATQLSSDLAVDAAKLSLPPSLTASIRTELDALFAESDRLGGLRAAQREATGNGAFVEQAAAERRILEQVLKVRAAAAGSVGSSMAREAYRQLFGGNQVLNEDGFRLTVPAEAKPELIREGLRRTLDMRLADQPAGVRALAGQGTWVDGGAGYVFYPRGSPSPLAIGGQPLQLTADQATQAATAPMIQNQAGVTPDQRRATVRRMNLNRSAP